jgi:NAD(P)-dependent dehydrogenase (short-subunit alcohol dehydrogenase family)
VFDLQDLVVIVSGAGRGLGREYAVGCARRGASVVVNDLGCDMDGVGEDPSVADAVVDDIRRAGGIAVASYDSVATPEGGQAIVARATAEFGRLDAVVSNAGVYSMMPFEDIPVETWRRMRSVHLDGAFHVSQPAFKVMKTQDGGGRFVFVASAAGAFGIPMAAHYAAAKAGVMGLTNNIAYEGAPYRIKANAILPFGISRMALSGGEPVPGTVLAHSSPELVAVLVTFLASRSCDFTHRFFSACAGRYARVFIGLAEGWHGDLDAVPSDDEFIAQLDVLASAEPYTIPESIVDEMEVVARALGITGTSS